MTDNPVTVRPARHSDYDGLCDLFEELDLMHRVARPDLFYAPAGAVREVRYVRELIDGPQSTILVAASERGLLGFATLVVRTAPASQVRRARRFVEVDGLAVSANARRQGVGRALMEAALAWARGRQIGAVELGVHDFNANAIAFYEALGFQSLARRMRIDARPALPHVEQT